MLPRVVPSAAIVCSLGLVSGVFLYELSRGEDPKPQPAANAPPVERPEPKPLSATTSKGLAYLVSQQQKNGGWGQEGGWRTGGQNGERRKGAYLKGPTDLGNTCVATLALLRAGNTPNSGPYAENVRLAVKYICAQIEKSDADSLYVTDVRDTQLQQKIGQYVDTFLAGLTLTELKGHMPDHQGEQQLLAALNKTLSKIESNQQEDGTFAGNHGWAPVLSQGLCSKFINRAAQQKLPVSSKVLERDYEQTVAQLDRRTGEFRSSRVAAKEPLSASAVASARPAPGAAVASGGSAGDAGVDLYNTASNAGRLQAFTDTQRQVVQEELKTILTHYVAPEKREQAHKELARAREVRAEQELAVRATLRKLNDEQFIAGFGNNGGEEFLSYMNISEMLFAEGGEQWRRWDESISKRLADVQNSDGSWSGHHCITGRTFCTATALLTLMADRSPGQLAAQLKKAN